MGGTAADVAPRRRSRKPGGTIARAGGGGGAGGEGFGEGVCREQRLGGLE